jgi:ABC-2 type transport system permease protein
MRDIFLQAGMLWQREIVRFLRQRSRVMSAILTPLVFWLLLGSGLKASFKPSGMPSGADYVEYFYPGVIVLMLLFTAIFATASTVDDRKQGFLQGVMVAPVSRTTIVLGQALGCTTLALMQGVVFLALAPLAGIWPGVEAIAASAAMMAVIAFAMTSMGLALAWRIESTQGFHAIMNLLLLPIWMLSGAVFPLTGAPGWLRWTTLMNPLTYAVTALRHGLYLGEPSAAGAAMAMPIGSSVAIAIAFAALAFAMAARVAERASTI